MRHEIFVRSGYRVRQQTNLQQLEVIDDETVRILYVLGQPRECEQLARVDAVEYPDRVTINGYVGESLARIRRKPCVIIGPGLEEWRTLRLGFPLLGRPLVDGFRVHSLPVKPHD